MQEFPPSVEKLAQFSVVVGKPGKVPADVEGLSSVSTGDEKVSAGVEEFGQPSVQVEKPARDSPSDERLMELSGDVGKLGKISTGVEQPLKPSADVEEPARLSTTVEGTG